MTPDEEKILKRAWEYHKDLNAVLLSRLNYSMVAQSMLVAAFATTFNAENRGYWNAIVNIVICLFGLFYSIVQYLLSYTPEKRMAFLKKTYLRRLDPVYEEHYKIGKRPWGIQVYWIPIALAMTWGMFLFAALMVS